MVIAKLDVDDLSAVDTLMKHDASTLGFLPYPALAEYLDRGGGLGAKTSNGRLAGYLLFAANSVRFRVTQLCVSPDHRRQGVARQLLDYLKNASDGRKYITLNCRHDFPATDIWPRMGFIALDEKRSRSRAEDRRLLQWYLRLAPGDQLDMFREKTCEDALSVVIDAQVLFNFREPDSRKTIPSKSLYTDYPDNVLELQVTEEIFNEISRSSNPDQREMSRRAANELVVLRRDGRSLEHIENMLRQVLPRQRNSSYSDIRHLATVAASDTNIFVTEDRGILKKTDDILRAVGVKVMSPASLIVYLHEQANVEAYRSRRVSGTDLKWSRLTASELQQFPVSRFVGEREKEGVFRRRFQALLANPEKRSCDVLYLRDDIVAYRVVETARDRGRTLLMGGVMRTTDRALIASFLVADTVRQAIKDGVSVVIVCPDALQPELLAAYQEVDFWHCGDLFLRICIAKMLTRKDALREISRHCPRYAAEFSSISDYELERRCSPLYLQSSLHPGRYFLVPIQPEYAMSLIDENRAAGDLFGGALGTLIRWDNVYYRAKTRHKMLQDHSRVLWYVTGKQKSVVAVSHLDGVDVGEAGCLFKKYRQKGVFNWEDLYKLCGGEPSKEIMALRFSHTFPFSNPIGWREFDRLLANANIKHSLPSPMKISEEVFRNVYRLGFGD